MLVPTRTRASGADEGVLVIGGSCCLNYGLEDIAHVEVEVLYYLRPDSREELFGGKLLEQPGRATVTLCHDLKDQAGSY